jgi:hypothetical protein
VAPERFRSLTIGGASPNGHRPPGPNFLDLFQQGMGTFLAWGAEAFGQRWTPKVQAMFSANDLQALAAVMSVRDNLGINDLLPTVSMPCLLFGGAEDTFYAGAEERVRRMPNAACVSLAGLDHIEAMFRPDLVIPHFRKFLAQVDQSQR